MKLRLLTSVLMIATSTFAGTLKDSIPLSSDYISGRPPQSYKATFRITADQIAHLPFTNITEVLNGMFPYVFGDPLNASDYNFLVDGRLVLNPNAVNVSQIAAIEFYPVYFGIGNGSLSGKGTFIIHIKHRLDRNGFRIRSQAGVILPTDKSEKILPSAPIKPDKREMFTYQDIAYNYGNNDLNFTSSLSYTRNAFPGFDNLRFGVQSNYDHGFNRIRFSNFIGYDISDKLKLTGSLSLHGHNNNYDMGTVASSDVSDTYDISAKTLYGAGSVGAEYRWSSRLRNTLQIEYSRLNRNYQSENYYYRPSPNPDTYTNYDWTTKEKQIAVTNALRGIVNQQKNFALHWELLLRYYSRKLDEHILYLNGEINGQPYQMSEGNIIRKHRSLAIMPRVGVTLNDRLFVTAGLTYDSWTNDIDVLTNDDDASNKVFPYAGVRWSMPAADNGFSSLHIHTTYGKTLLRGSSSDLLDFNPNSAGYFPTYSYQPMPATETGYRWVSGIDAGFLQDRLLVSLNYFMGRNFPAIIFGGGPDPIRHEEVKQNGLSASVQARISDKEKFRCNLRAILFYEKNELANKALVSGIGSSFRISNPFLNDDISPQWLGSFQANISSGGVFLQAIALLRPTDGRWRQSSDREKFNNSGLSFLSAGYRFNSAKRLKDLEMSIQTRNLLLMKEPVSDFYTERYIGIGINAKL